MSRDPRIDTYIAKAQPFARPILDHVRDRVHGSLPDVEETIKWSMPAYTLGGKIVLITAAFKAHVALNFWRGQELRGEAANANPIATERAHVSRLTVAAIQRNAAPYSPARYSQELAPRLRTFP